MQFAERFTYVLPKKRNIIGISIAGAISIVLLLAAGWLILNRQYVVDQVAVWAYSPNDQIARIQDRVDFTEKGKFYLYATQPEILYGDSFNQQCPRQEVGSPILGCYANSRTFIFDVTNDQLDGIEEVTAAHEMLHAAWERLSDIERQRVGELLRKQYSDIDNEALQTRIAYYERTEPGQLENELHSILGTEVSNISDELERYYAQYFEDRSIVVALHDSYNSVFVSLSDRSDTLYKQLVSLEDAIDKSTQQYNRDILVLSADIDDFNRRAENNGFSSQAQFNQERAALVARSNQLDDRREAINADIATYNATYDEYQDVASQVEALNKSIDSFETLAPSPSL